MTFICTARLHQRSRLALSLFLVCCLTHQVCGAEEEALKSETKTEGGETKEGADKPPAEPLKEYTLEELRQYDGSDPDLPILLALKGSVFDVTSGKKFYHPGKAYASFAGRDVTRNTAMFVKDPSTLDRTDFPAKRQKYLEKVYKGTYQRKYPIVGWINNPTQPPPGWVEPDDGEDDEEEEDKDTQRQADAGGEEGGGGAAGWLRSAWSSLTGSTPEL
mmetsp:Transcript_60481/g.142709  ORF Transcript_60481/g.142709 Transcript_60481/m.142709 type:complete len:218 (+) Transcript_60481:76-729(+)